MSEDLGHRPRHIEECEFAGMELVLAGEGRTQGFGFPTRHRTCCTQTVDVVGWRGRLVSLFCRCGHARRPQLLLNQRREPSLLEVLSDDPFNVCVL